MRTPEERYYQDPEYKQLVDLLTEQIRAARFSPSELREAAVLAAIRFETSRPHPSPLPPEVQSWLRSAGEQRDRREESDGPVCGDRSGSW